MEYFGYMGKVLQIDLTAFEVRQAAISRDHIEKFVGGASLGGKMLVDRFKPGITAYDPGNPFIIMTGPLTGTSLPGCVNYSVITQSPANGFAVCTNANGWFGWYLKTNGLDGIELVGRADHLTYILIEGGRVQFIPAGDLKGKGILETTGILTEKHGPCSVGCIGPAGENLVRFAGFIADSEHSASKSGTGAVLGSKNIKAIVVKKSGFPSRIHDDQAYRAAFKKWKGVDRSAGLSKVVSQRGMRGLFESLYADAIVPVKNLTENDFAGQENFHFENFNKPFAIERNSCPTCDFFHFNRLKFEGTYLKEPSFDTIVGFGTNVGIGDPVECAKLTTLVDDLGLEAQEASWLLAWLIECQVERVLDKDQVDGLELKWGAYEPMVKLLRKVAYREGCGDYFAEGIYRSAKGLGQDAFSRAVYVKKGGVPQLMDNRNDWPFLFGEIMTNVGSREASTNKRYTFSDGKLLGIEYPGGDDIVRNEKTLARHHASVAPRAQLPNIIGLCQLHGANSYLDLLSESLLAVTGIRFTPQDLQAAGERMITMMRIYNIWNGHDRSCDMVSERFVSTVAERGINAGRPLDAYLSDVIDEYYHLMGWDREGTPLPETVQRLGLDSLKR